jgi:hypothetical protein
VWTGQEYVDGDTGEVLPTWDQALDQLDDAALGAAIEIDPETSH